MSISRVLRLCAVLLAVLFLCGCMQSVIREDAQEPSLPGIDPAAGVGRDVDITLYFRLTGEPALVPVQRTVTVRANEYVESAVIRQLIAGPTALYGDLEAVIPAGTRLLELSRDGGILYVTLSKEMLSDSAANTSREEAELKKRLSVYAIVNSLCALGDANRVQVMIDTDGTGKGTRVSPFLLGFTSEYTSSQWLEPMGMEQSVVITPTLFVKLAMQHLVDQDYAQAYQFFAESEPGGLQKPDYAAFETDMLSLGTIDAFTIRSAEAGKGSLSGKAVLDVTWTSAEDKKQRTVKNVTLQLIPEGELNKIGFFSLLDTLRAG